MKPKWLDWFKALWWSKPKWLDWFKVSHPFRPQMAGLV